MLAEIFLVQLETELRDAARKARPSSSEGRFVPFASPRESVPGAGARLRRPVPRPGPAP